MKILGQAGGNLAESPESGFAAIVNRARQLAGAHLPIDGG